MASSSGSKAKFIIRSGSFWDLYLAINITNGQEMAVKLESQKTRHPQFKLCKILQGRVGIPPTPRMR
uniref:Protein kinase domain-containing protein n=1 Tax=Mandrillus leucophaeus TaxID=9568 RepID=A0A2K5YJT3_MANLE